MLRITIKKRIVKFFSVLFGQQRSGRRSDQCEFAPNGLEYVIPKITTVLKSEQLPPTSKRVFSFGQRKKKSSPLDKQTVDAKK
jgi:hypothetical protein